MCTMKSHEGREEERGGGKNFVSQSAGRGSAEAEGRGPAPSTKSSSIGEASFVEEVEDFTEA